MTASPANTRTIPSARRPLDTRHAAGVRQCRTHTPPPSTRRPGTSTKRPLDIEEVLTWCFRHELTKRRDDDRGPRLGFSSISPMFRMADLGVRVENFSREPGMPAALGEPHPDALIVEAAVLELARFADHRFEGDLGLTPFLPPGLDDVAAMTRAMQQLVATVQVHARLGKRPSFTKSMEPAAVIGRNGKPQVCILRTEMRADRDGILRAHHVEEPCGAEGKDRYPRGAYCQIEWDDPRTILMERADYAAWWAGIDVLAHALRGKLATIAVLPPAAAQRPWAGDVDLGKPARVLDAPASRAKLRDQQETDLARRILAHRRRSAGTRRRPKIAQPASAQA
nr:hypothetical protein NG677_12125 [Methylobacterium sp. OTU13CASTA1]